MAGMGSIDYLVTFLINRIDRRNIFPPLYNDPESYLSPVDKPQPKKPPNQFLIFRRNVYNEAKRNGVNNMRAVTKVASILWNHAPRNDKNIYKILSDCIQDIYFARRLGESQ